MMSDIINEGIYLDYEPMYEHEVMKSIGKIDVTGEVEGFDEDTIPVLKYGMTSVPLTLKWNELYGDEMTLISRIFRQDSKELFNEIIIPFMDGLRLISL